MKKKCVICEKIFSAKTNRTVYCSDECRNKGKRDKQRQLMKQKRKNRKITNLGVLNPNKKTDKKVLNPNKKTINDLRKYYRQIKKEILANEKMFGFVSRTLIEGIEIHEENFEELIIEKTKGAVNRV